MKIIGINVKTEVGREIIPNNTKQTLAVSIHSEKMSHIYISQLKDDSPKSLMFSILAQNALSKSNCVVSLSTFGISMNFVRVQYLNI